MADVFAVSLHAFAEDNTHRISRTNHSGPTELGAGTSGLLSLLTVIGTSLSIVGVVLTFITYSLFSDLRTLSGNSLLNLLAALFLSHLLSVIGVERSQDHNLCLTMAFLLHYLWLAVHFWVTSMAWDMYRTFRDNINLKPSTLNESQKSLLRCALFSWGVPLVFVGLSAVLHFKTHLDDLPIVKDTCWIVGPGSLIYAFAIPAGLLCIFDIMYFCKTAIVIHQTVGLQMNRKTKNKMRKRRYLQLCLYSKLVILLVATWFSCVMAQLTNQISLWYVFTLLISLQGFFVALSYSCNSRVFRLYGKNFRSGKSSSGYGTSELSQSTSLTLLTWQPSPDSV
ncbi:adhesion G protein-coupled receptor E2-like [Centruroides sculpturatus]|uniref:adhesion G protein-coupled receptor E2-like n=1 Tax=Centruroides sculpturatus TaxID=218467 RepID=UPI000C6D46BF|nr:adhesion G protein-coupled receptor E2-like [Centruroides sculpturatus]